MTDPFIVRSTADIMLAGFPREAQRIAILLSDDCLSQGDPGRAEMWAEVAHAIAEMTNRSRLH